MVNLTLSYLIGCIVQFKFNESKDFEFATKIQLKLNLFYEQPASEMDGGYPGSSSDWGTILGMLKSDDEMLVYQGAMELRDSLSYAQEN